MFEKMRKGQASVEYVIILTIVILIALVVSAVLANFPTQASGASVSQSESYWTSADIGLSQVFFSETAGFATLRNNRPFPITPRNVSDLSGAIVNSSAVASALQPGETLVNFGLTFPANTCPSGSTFSRRFFVTYTDSNNNLYNFTGSIPLVGRCQA